MPEVAASYLARLDPASGMRAHDLATTTLYAPKTSAEGRFLASTPASAERPMLCLALIDLARVLVGVDVKGGSLRWAYHPISSSHPRGTALTLWAATALECSRASLMG